MIIGMEVSRTPEYFHNSNTLLLHDFVSNRRGPTPLRKDHWAADPPLHDPRFFVGGSTSFGNYPTLKSSTPIVESYIIFAADKSYLATVYFQKEENGMERKSAD